MEKQKRGRNANFSEEETNLLVDLTAAKKHIIECKKNDATTWRAKEQAWKDIERTFNKSTDYVHRDHKHLKAKYEGLKREARRKTAIYIATEFKNGEDETKSMKPRPVLTAAEKKINEILQSTEEESIDSDFIQPEIEIQEEEPMDSTCMSEDKIEIEELQRRILTEDLEQKLIQRQILEKELEHKQVIHELEKQHLLLKIELATKALKDS